MPDTSIPQDAPVRRSNMPRDAAARMTAGEAAVEAFKEYARERPEIVTMWAFGLGFVLGWKLRIW